MSGLQERSRYMNAWFLIRNGAADQAFEIRQVEIPEPGRGQIRIRVTAFGINYADVAARQGTYKECPPLPCVIGYDVEGVVDKTGEGVTDINQGDRVFALTRFGGYAEYVIAEAMAVGRLDERAEPGIGCALAVQCVTAYYATMMVQTLLPGEKVLLHAAAGGMGTAIIQIAKSRGCVVIGVVGGQEKAAYLQKLGVEYIIDHHSTDYTDFIREKLGGRVDVIFDNIGGKSIRRSYAILAFGGRLVSLGAAARGGKRGIIPVLRLVIGFGWFSPIRFLLKSQSFIGINMLTLADRRPDIVAEAFKGVQRLYSQGILQPHIGRIFDARDLPSAHQEMEDRRSIGKFVVKW
jgi:NADPH2:quinone reductase